MKLSPRFRSVSFWLRTSAVMTLVALALMVWSVVEPTPLPVMLAMTVGQGLGTTAFAIFIIVVFKDLTRVRRLRRDSLQNIDLSSRDSLQNIGLSRHDSVQDVGPAPRDSLQNIGLSKEEP